MKPFEISGTKKGISERRN